MHDDASMQPLTLSGWMRWAIVRRVIPPDVESVLEIGAGLGAMGSMLAQRFDYLGLEPDETSYRIAARRTNGRVRNVTAEGFSGTADLVCAFEVIEHIGNDAEALASWRRLSNRWLLLSTPADPNRFGPWDESAGHYRRYTEAALSASIRAGGWEPRRIRHYGFPIGYWLDSARQLVGKRRARQASAQELTAASGRQFQPPARLAYATWAAALPARLLQAPFPGRGHGLIALAELA